MDTLDRVAKENFEVKQQVNGHPPPTCPFSVESDYTNGNNDEQKSVKSNLRIKVAHPIELRNHVIEGCENYDSLYSHIDDVSTSFKTKCSDKVCQSSVMGIQGRGNTPRTPEEVYQEAQVFLRQYFACNRREDSAAHKARLQEIKAELQERGTYQLTSSELTYGAKLAWRNATRCIGRIQWKKLRIFDCREVRTATGMFEALCSHIKFGTNKGNIRSAITIFPQRTDGKHDYRVWNPQLISYAGYQQPDGSILGDPARVEFTEICMKLGWKPKRTAWDVLPLVLSADGKDPEYFDIPPEIIMEVMIEHPDYNSPVTGRGCLRVHPHGALGDSPAQLHTLQSRLKVYKGPLHVGFGPLHAAKGPGTCVPEILRKYDWFKELGLRWYALPAVSNMRMDCGGLEFTATAFNGWYMGTEIGCRNFCDSNRFNFIELIAKNMGLDTNTAATLWKDKALVEINIAVLHSYHRDNVSIVDHHSASEQFMKHMETESRVRGGCPSDWIWIVPPMSSSLTPVFHQEMALYYLRPSYDYQEPAWKTHQWTKTDGTKTTHRKFNFKQIARAVKFTSKLFTRALSKRIKATILYATETGKSEQYAKELGTLFGHAFNAQVHSMADYDMFSIEHETLLIIVTSTFGNGEPPANGKDFADHLIDMLNDSRDQETEMDGNLMYKTSTPRTLGRTNSMLAAGVDYKRQLTRLESNKSSKSLGAASSSVETLAPLSNVCFAVFGLGSSAYPKFCNFGKTIDALLGNLGGERIMEVCCGDEMYGQEQQFRTWSDNIFHVACETFCLDEDDMLNDAKRTLTTLPLTEETVRFEKATHIPLIKALELSFRKQLITCKVQEKKCLTKHTDSNNATISVYIEIDDDVRYDPGDHIGIMALNNKEIVDAVLDKLKGVEDYEKVVQLQVMREILTPTGMNKDWERHERLPSASLRELYTRFLDITTPPTAIILKYLASTCTDEKEAAQIQELVTDSNKYDDWRHFHFPNLAEVFELFPSCRPQAALLTALLPPLQPRFYSISSSLLEDSKSVHLTVAVIMYKTQNGNGPVHHGVCSTYLNNLKQGDQVLAFIRRAPSFHMPKDVSAPLILVGPGTGIAPFRGFWHHRRNQIKNYDKNLGKIWLFFGCRYQFMDLYKDEKQAASEEGVLDKVFLALSREEWSKKKYVQELLEDEGAEVTRMLTEENGHFYVCGDCKMAENVQQKLKAIIQKHAKMADQEAEEFIYSLMDDNRYHEDIFGITLRTAEVQSASRESAKKTRLESQRSQNSLKE